MAGRSFTRETSIASSLAIVPFRAIKEKNLEESGYVIVTANTYLRRERWLILLRS
jgi:hypothetical protein